MAFPAASVSFQVVSPHLFPTDITNSRSSTITVLADLAVSAHPGFYLQFVLLGLLLLVCLLVSPFLLQSIPKQDILTHGVTLVAAILVLMLLGNAMLHLRLWLSKELHFLFLFQS